MGPGRSNPEHQNDATASYLHQLATPRDIWGPCCLSIAAPPPRIPVVPLAIGSIVTPCELPSLPACCPGVPVPPEVCINGPSVRHCLFRLTLAFSREISLNIVQCGRNLFHWRQPSEHGNWETSFCLRWSTQMQHTKDLLATSQTSDISLNLNVNVIWNWYENCCRHRAKELITCPLKNSRKLCAEVGSIVLEIWPHYFIFSMIRSAFHGRGLYVWCIPWLCTGLQFSKPIILTSIISKKTQMTVLLHNKWFPICTSSAIELD